MGPLAHAEGDHSRLEYHFGQATQFTNFLHNDAAFEYLKSVGLSVVTNDALRRGITHYYEVEAQYLISVEQLFVNGNWSDAVKPQMLEKFEYEFFLKPATPRDYTSLMSDFRYQSVLATTRDIIDWKDDRTRSAVGAAEELLGRIRSELARR